MENSCRPWRWNTSKNMSSHIIVILASSLFARCMELTIAHDTSIFYFCFQLIHLWLENDCLEMCNFDMWSVTSTSPALNIVYHDFLFFHLYRLFSLYIVVNLLTSWAHHLSAKANHVLCLLHVDITTIVTLCLPYITSVWPLHLQCVIGYITWITSLVQHA